MRILATSVFSILMLTSVAAAQNSRALEEGVNLIVSTAEAVCLAASTQGSSGSTSVEGEVDGGLGVLSKRLLELGIEGAGRLTEEEFSNVLREDLAAELNDNRRCREKIFDAMFARIFGDTPETVLSDAQQKVLEGRVRSHALNLVESGTQFAMRPGDTVAIHELTTTFPHSKWIGM